MTDTPTPKRFSPEQLAAIEFARTGEGNMLIEAVAGSGKTTTGVGIAEALPNVTGLSVAFARKNAEDLRERMPDNFEVKTMNGLGHAAWGKHLGRKLTLNQYKVADWFDKRLGRTYPADLRRLASLAKANGIVPRGAQGQPKGLLPDDMDSYLDLVDAYDLDFSNDKGNVLSDHAVVELVRECLVDGIKAAWNGLIDYDDQLYMPVMYGSRFPRYDVVFSDESQDLSALQMRMLKRLNAGRTFMVGDRHQGIYGFRGASLSAMDTLKEMFKAVEFPLHVSFRCPRNVVKAARRYVSHIRAADNAPDGLVQAHDAWDIDVLVPGSFVVCRNSAPIVSLALFLIRKGISANVLGRDIGATLKKFIKKFPSAATCAELEVKVLDALHLEQQAAAGNRHAEAKLQSFEDRVFSVTGLIEELPSTATLNDLLEVIDRIFADKTGSVTLMTGHKSKGLEANVVFRLDPWRNPSRQAIRRAEAGDDGPMRQEKNLAYVETTRAMQELHLVNRDGLKGAKRNAAAFASVAPTDLLEEIMQGV